MRAADFCGGNALSDARRHTVSARAVLRRSGSAIFAVTHCGTALSLTVSRRCAASPLTVTGRSAVSARAVLRRSGSAIFAVTHCGTALSLTISRRCAASPLTVSRLLTSSMRVFHLCGRPRLAFFVRNPPHTVERSRPSPPSRRGLHGFQNPLVVHFAQQSEQLFLFHSGIPSFCISSLSLRRMRARIVRTAPSLRPVRRASSAISSRNQ